MYFWDSITDFFHTSENERKRDEYQKLVNYLSKKIPKAENFYEELDKGCKSEFTIMNGSSSDASGVLAFMYDQKFDTYKEDTESLLNYYSRMISLFYSSLSTAQAMYAYYVEQCRIEDELRRQRIREENERQEREAKERKEAAKNK